VLESPDPRFATILDQARKVAATDTVVLIRGESGTGKGVLARRIHGCSRRSSGPFVTVSCPSLSSELLESELFGHARGAFTGAVRDTSGKVAAAAGGTLFLDEIGDLPLALQPKLLRFLQERRYERVGESQTRTADVRLIAATNHDLDAEVAAGRFRDDLMYRLNVVDFTLPPLRKRSDLLDLADHLLTFFSRQTGHKIEGFTPAARAAIANYPWPGNLRELRNAIERAALFVSGPMIEVADLPDRVATAARPQSPAATGPVVVGGQVTLERLETEHIRRLLEETETREEAARILGIDPSTLYRKRKQLGL
jgi:NtrC-family two-component system response regulator AlgB